MCIYTKRRNQNNDKMVYMNFYFVEKKNVTNFKQQVKITFFKQCKNN